MFCCLSEYRLEKNDFVPYLPSAPAASYDISPTHMDGLTPANHTRFSPYRHTWDGAKFPHTDKKPQVLRQIVMWADQGYTDTEDKYTLFFRNKLTWDEARLTDKLKQKDSE